MLGHLAGQWQQHARLRLWAGEAELRRGEGPGEHARVSGAGALAGWACPQVFAQARQGRGLSHLAPWAPAAALLSRSSSGCFWSVS